MEIKFVGIIFFITYYMYQNKKAIEKSFVSTFALRQNTAKVIKSRKNMEGKCHCKFSGFGQQPLLSEEDASISLSSYRSQPSEIEEEHM